MWQAVQVGQRPVMVAIAWSVVAAALITASTAGAVVSYLRDNLGVGCWTTSDGPRMCSDGSAYALPVLSVFVLVTFLLATVSGTVVWYLKR